MNTKVRSSKTTDAATELPMTMTITHHKSTGYGSDGQRARRLPRNRREATEQISNTKVRSSAAPACKFCGLVRCCCPPRGIDDD